MAISKELFLALLSMDAYNRGYGSGIADGVNLDPDGNDLDGLGGPGSRIGSALVTRDDISEVAQAAGFYAIAYTLTEAVGEGPDALASGTTVISYRGTDTSIDYLKGWLIGAGVTAPITQADETMAFYHAVAGTLGPDANLIVTGHSLGGGLACRPAGAFA